MDSENDEVIMVGKRLENVFLVWYIEKEGGRHMERNIERGGEKYEGNTLLGSSRNVGILDKSAPG